MSDSVQPEPGVKMAVGAATMALRNGLGLHVQRAMSDVVTRLTAAGVSTDEKHSSIIRAAMLKAREKVLDQARLTPPEFARKWDAQGGSQLTDEELKPFADMAQALVKTGWIQDPSKI